MAGNDNLYGQAGDDRLDGGIGNDYLVGGAGADVYIFGRGSGKDTINNADSDAAGTKLDKIQLGEGISVSDVTVHHDYFDLVLSINDTTDELRIFSYFDQRGTSGYAVDQIQFQDGTVWDVAAVRAIRNVETEGADYLDGGAEDDTFDGRGGNDIVNGNAGNDNLSGGEGAFGALAGEVRVASLLLCIDKIEWLVETLLRGHRAAGLLEDEFLREGSRI